MADNPFDKEKFGNPGAWRAAMLIDGDTLAVAARTTSGDDRMVYHVFTLEGSDGSTMRSLQDVICAYPVLLGEFGSVEVLFGGNRMVAVTDSFDSDTCHAVASALWGGDDTAVVADKVQGTDIVLLHAADEHVAGLLRRSLYNPRIRHRLTPLVEYFGRNSRLGNNGKAFVNLRDGGVDVMVFGPRGLSLANSYPAACTADAVYFTLAACKAAGFDFIEDEMLLCGSTRIRPEATAELRKFANSVMPVIFPSEVLKAAGNEALNIPFELIVSLL